MQEDKDKHEPSILQTLVMERMQSKANEASIKEYPKLLERLQKLRNGFSTSDLDSALQWY